MCTETQYNSCSTWTGEVAQRIIAYNFRFPIRQKSVYRFHSKHLYNFTSIPDYFDVEDEVLEIIAEELGTMIVFVGGSYYYPHLLVPLERLCTVEELFIAEKVIHLSLLEFSDSLRLSHPFQ